MGSASTSAVHLVIEGRVQGVGFRYFTQAEAGSFGITGWVRNVPEGHVEAYGEGSREHLEQWVRRLHQGPPLSRVESIRESWQKPEMSSTLFSIR